MRIQFTSRSQLVPRHISEWLMNSCRVHYFLYNHAYWWLCLFIHTNIALFLNPDIKCKQTKIKKFSILLIFGFIRNLIIVQNTDRFNIHGHVTSSKYLQQIQFPRSTIMLIFVTSIIQKGSTVINQSQVCKNNPRNVRECRHVCFLDNAMQCTAEVGAILRQK